MVSVFSSLSLMPVSVLCLVVPLLTSHAVQAEIPALYHDYANKHGIPVAVFFSVIKQESGKTTQQRYLPWPWTLNVNHQAYYYDNAAEARAALSRFLADEDNTIAVGLGQIYLPAHGDKFTDSRVLLNPHINLDFAAWLLHYEYQHAQGNWWVAVGRYHHPSKPQFAIPYRESVYRKCLNISRHCARYGEIQP